MKNAICASLALSILLLGSASPGTAAPAEENPRTALKSVIEQVEKLRAETAAAQKLAEDTVSRLSAELAIRTRELSELKTRRANLADAEKHQILADQKNAEVAIRQLSASVEARQKGLEDAQMTIKNLQAQTALNKEDVSTPQSQSNAALRQAQEKVNQLTAELQKRDAALAGSQAEMKNMRSEVTALQKKAEAATEKLARDLKVREQEITKLQASMQSRVESLQAEALSAKKSADESAANYRALLDARNKAETASGDAVKTLLIELEASKTESSKAMAGLSQQLQEQKTRTLEAQAALKDLRAQQLQPNPAKSEIQTLRVQLAERDQLVKQLLQERKGLEEKIALAAERRTDQAKPAPATPKSIAPVVYGSSHFNSAREKQRVLQEVQAILKDHPNAKFSVAGYTSNEGDATASLRASAQHAQEIADHLKAGGISVDKLSVVAGGEAKPVASNKTAAGRAKNKRVEIEATLP